MSFPAYAAYRDSGVPWLGVVPAHWSAKALRFLMSCNDEVLSEDTPPDYEVDYVEISDVDEVGGVRGSETMKFADAPSRARRLVRDGDIILSTVRTYLRAIATVANPPGEHGRFYRLCSITPSGRQLPICKIRGCLRRFCAGGHFSLQRHQLSRY